VAIGTQPRDKRDSVIAAIEPINRECRATAVPIENPDRDGAQSEERQARTLREGGTGGIDKLTFFQLVVAVDKKMLTLLN
jgi:hypothetical protein